MPKKPSKKTLRPGGRTARKPLFRAGGRSPEGFTIWVPSQEPSSFTREELRRAVRDLRHGPRSDKLESAG